MVERDSEVTSGPCHGRFPPGSGHPSPPATLPSSSLRPSTTACNAIAWMDAKPATSLHLQSFCEPVTVGGGFELPADLR